MTIRDLLRLVLSNLKRMKARVAMTAIGVIIGTAAVIVLVSVGPVCRVWRRTGSTVWAALPS